MLNKGLLIFLILILSAGFVLANAPIQSNSVKDKPLTAEKLIGPNSILPAPEGLGGVSKPLETDDPIGDTFIFGETWYDIQHNGTCGRQLQVDNDGWIHLVWMRGLNEGASQRHIWYQLMDPDDQLMFTGSELGMQVDQSPRAGYTVMELHPDNRAMPTFHQMTPGYINFHTALAFDYFPRTGAFSPQDLPWVWEGINDLEVIWPRMDVDISDRYHTISTENPASGVAGAIQRIYYCRSNFDPLTYTINFETPEQIEIVWTEVIASDVAASPVSNRVAIGWMEFNATNPDTNQIDNDLILCISEDGVEWDWSDTINVTNWIPPNLSHLPGTPEDTLWAHRDTLRCYTDMCLLYDYNDVLHVFFSTHGYWALDLFMGWTWGNGYIWHWDDSLQVFSMVANGWYDNGFYDPGAWNKYVQRPSAAVDPETGDLYCMYQRYFDVVGPSTQYPFPYLEGDTADWSLGGWPNGEIWMSKSTNGGYSWSEGLNVTNTHTPNAAPGDCKSELTPCMAPEIYGGYAHIFYIMDHDAGAVVQTEGVWTLNEAMYHRVPISEIPESPRFIPYPMHCDSTGMPEDTVVSVNDYTRGVTPKDFILSQNYPNPFNPTTKIKYSLHKDGFAVLKVYNIYGEEVVELFDGFRDAGVYEASFDASNLASGVYFYRLTANGYSVAKKMVLMK